MKYVNRITFGNIKSQWELLKMRAAYIMAEQMIIEEAAKGNDITGHDAPKTTNIIFTSDSTNPEELDNFSFSFGEEPKPLTDIEQVYAKAVEVREKLDNAIHDNDFVKAQMYQNVLDGLELKYKRLKGNE